ncbi:MAG: lytic transglycosylase domain-containing protein [Thermodesulfobacteriota bacterium]
MRPRSLSLCLAVPALLAALAWIETAGAWSMYYYQDEQGVYHFTNKPRGGRKWSLFAVYRDFPDVGKEKILEAVRASSKRNGMDHRLVQAVIQVESNFQSDAVSPAGAQGIMQIMPQTQKDLGLTSPFDYRLNIEAGVRYLRMQYDRFRRLDLALAAYNAGPEAVEKHGGIPPYAETRDYVRKVLTLYRKLGG